MAQDYPDILSTDLVSASRANILARDNAIKSSFAGTAFPTTDLTVGQTCYRTDLSKVYVLESTGPAVWRELQLAASLGTAAAKNTGTSGNNVPLLDGANTWSAAQTFSAALNLGTQLLNTSGGSLSGDTDLRLNAGASKNMNFLINSVSRALLYADGGMTIGAPTGNSKGAGTLNAEALYSNNNLIKNAAFRETGVETGKIPLWDNFGTAAFVNTGLSSGQVPLANTLADHAKQIYPGGTTNFLREDGTWAMPPLPEDVFIPIEFVGEAVLDGQTSAAITWTYGLYSMIIIELEYINTSAGFGFRVYRNGTEYTGSAYYSGTIPYHSDQPALINNSSAIYGPRSLRNSNTGYAMASNVAYFTSTMLPWVSRVYGFFIMPGIHTDTSVKYPVALGALGSYQGNGGPYEMTPANWNVGASGSGINGIRIYRYSSGSFSTGGRMRIWGFRKPS